MAKECIYVYIVHFWTSKNCNEIVRASVYFLEMAAEGEKMEPDLEFLITTKTANAMPPKTTNNKHQPQHPPDFFFLLSILAIYLFLN